MGDTRNCACAVSTVQAHTMEEHPVVLVEHLNDREFITEAEVATLAAHHEPYFARADLGDMAN